MEKKRKWVMGGMLIVKVGHNNSEIGKYIKEIDYITVFNGLVLFYNNKHIFYFYF